MAHTFPGNRSLPGFRFDRRAALLPAVAACVLFEAGPVHATPVQVIECGIFLPAQPLPSDYLDLHFTIRRHIEHTVPVESLETEIWSQAKYQDNGYFEVTVYPLEGEPRVERSTSVLTTVLDGNAVIGDEYADQALTMEKTIEYDGYTLDSVAFGLKKKDGTAIDDTGILTEIDLADWDPQVCDSGEGGSGRCDVQCYVRWLAPPPGVVCGTGTGGSTLCKTGTYQGTITSISYEPHGADHGGGFAINAGLNDAWVSAGAPLQGMFITVFEELGLVFAAWFTFDTPAEAQIAAESAGAAAASFGAGDQRWVTAVGPFSGNRAELKAELTSGGLFNSNDPMPEQETDYGTIELEFDGCNAGHVTFDFPSAGQSGEFDITRTLEDNVALCEDRLTQQR